MAAAYGTCQDKMRYAACHCCWARRYNDDDDDGEHHGRSAVPKPNSKSLM